MMALEMVFRCVCLSLLAAAIGLASMVTIIFDCNVSPLCAAISFAFFTTWSFVFADIAMRTPANSHSLNSLLTQYFFTRLLQLLGRMVLRRFDKLTRHSDCGQENLLTEFILQKNIRTEFGKSHSFKSIKTKEDYRLNVPMSVYSDYRIYFEKLAESDDVSLRQNIMTEDSVIYLATSSGTTGKNKTLPLTSFTKRNAALNINPVMVSVSTALGGFHLGRILVISYRAEKILCRSGLYKGPVSSHISKSYPFLVVPSEVYDIHNETLVLHLLAIYALAEAEICQIESLFSTLIYSFWRHIEHFWPLICGVIETGCLEFPDVKSNAFSFGGGSKDEVPRKDAWPQKCLVSTGDDSANSQSVLNHYISRNSEARIKRHLRADPSRASFLRKQFLSGFDGIALKIWPGLKYVRMINTGGFAPHAFYLGRIHLKGVLQLSLLHAASEGFFGLNLATNSDWRTRACYVLQPEFGFFEFINESSIYDQSQKSLFIEEIQIGENYEVVYTSQTGLYRYRTGDIIKITGFYNNCPTYEFLYRTGQVLNLFWEKTPEYVLNSAVELCVAKLDGLILFDFIATEDLHMPESYRKKHVRKHYVLFVGIRKGDRQVVLGDDETKKFDETLSEIFELYASLRRACSIDAMQVIQLNEDAFDSLRISSSSPQRKLPRVIRDPAKIQELLLQSLTPW